ncbi:hypothetical protein GCM10009851_19300 [Herbiconiux moechotypicola]|uniref:HTH luxR-type domain-containing protein n=1 Tax=Herbiconiux moechotypicola TaxID=637393 RepID=A0ABP5QIR1_9MICO
MSAAPESGGWAEVERLIERHWSALILDAPDALLSAVMALPEEVVLARPRWVSARNYLAYLPVDGALRPLRYRDSAPPALGGGLLDVLVQHTSRAAALRDAGETERAVVWVSDARRLLGEATEEALVELQPNLPDLHCQWAKAREFAGDSPAAFREYLDAYDLAVVTGNELIARNAAGGIAWLHTLAGRSGEALEWLARVPRAAGGEGWAHTRYGMAAHLSRVVGHLDRLEFDAAAELADRVLDVKLAPEYWAAILLVRARLARHRGDAREVLTELDATVQSRTEAASRQGANAYYLALARAELAIELNQTARAVTALSEVPDIPIAASYRDLARAVVASLSADAAGAARSLDALLAAQPSPPPRVVSEALVLRAAVRIRLGEAAEAAEDFRQAAGVMRAEGLLGAFRVLTRADFDALVAANRDRPEADWAREVVGDRPLFLPEPVGVAPLAALTPRERSVLAELASGDSLGAIAARLFVSQNTVKSQLRSAYRKLGVSNRLEAESAVARLGLRG